jgi:hypothetical protein
MPSVLDADVGVLGARQRRHAVHGHAPHRSEHLGKLGRAYASLGVAWLLKMQRAGIVEARGRSRTWCAHVTQFVNA